MFLPRKKDCPLSFLHAIYRGERKCLTKNQKREILWPNLPELSCEKVWAMAKSFPEVMKYMPPSWNNHTKAERAYVVTVMNTLMPEFMADWKADVIEQREALKEKVVVREKELDISPEWLEILARVADPGRKSSLFINVFISILF